MEENTLPNSLSHNISSTDCTTLFSWFIVNLRTYFSQLRRGIPFNFANHDIKPKEFLDILQHFMTCLFLCQTIFTNFLQQRGNPPRQYCEILRACYRDTLDQLALILFVSIARLLFYHTVTLH